MQYGKATGKDQPYLISTNVKQGQNRSSGYSTLIRLRKTIENHLRSDIACACVKKSKFNAKTGALPKYRYRDD
jgi:hypothetical protein